MSYKRLSLSDLQQLKRWNTPSVYNGWEQITNRDIAADCFNLEETIDFMPQMGPMVGYAVTLVIEPSNPAHKENKAAATAAYRQYMTSVPGPKIVIVQDLDKPRVVGSFWGEVAASVHTSLGCVGTIIDGAVRDIDEMTSVGMKVLAKRLCVGHAHIVPVRWNCEVEVYGCKIKPGQLIHADKHGFMVIPEEDEARLLDAVQFMDMNECQTVIPAARNNVGRPVDQILEGMAEAAKQFRASLEKKSFKKSEW